MIKENHKNLEEISTQNENMETTDESKILPYLTHVLTNDLFW